VQWRPRFEDLSITLSAAKKITQAERRDCGKVINLLLENLLLLFLHKGSKNAIADAKGISNMNLKISHTNTSSPKPIRLMPIIGKSLQAHW